MADIAVRASALVLRFRRILTIAVQLLLVVASNWIAFRLRFDSGLPPLAVAGFWQMLPWVVAVRGVTFAPFRLYEGLWRYTSIYDLRALVGGVAVSSVVLYGVTRSPLGPELYPRSIFVIDALVLITLLGGIRLARRLALQLPAVEPSKRVLIIGAGDAGERVLRHIKSDGAHEYRPIGFVDDDRRKVGLRIHGVPVLGTTADLPTILERSRPTEILIAVPNPDAPQIRAIVRAVESFKIPIKTLPNLHDILSSKVDIAAIRNLAVEDLLARAPVGLDPTPLHRMVAGRRVMVTGAGGSIGSELCRQIARLKPATIVMFDRYENGLHAIRLELADARLSFGVIPVIGDVTDFERLREVLDEHRPEIIFHAAAHKHVPLMEENPCEAVKNNVRGTRLLARAAELADVDRMILISTDKAVNPTSVMGASKRVAEIALQLEGGRGLTSFATVRFGNVLGSNGSVVPRFLEQIARGGPVTITHPEMRRFFMLIPEAVQLVLHAAAQADDGAVYVLEMGEQIKVIDMARDLIRLSGFVPDQDIKIQLIGLRPGEKLFEELVGADEEVLPSAVNKILCVRSRVPLESSLLAEIDQLEEDAAAGRTSEVRARLKALAGGPGSNHPSLQPVPAALGAGHRVARDPKLASVDGDPHCPVCESGRLHRSRVRNLPERVRRWMTPKRPFRCDTCKWRGWLVPITLGSPNALEHPQAPELTLLDQLGPPGEKPPTTSPPETFA